MSVTLQKAGLWKRISALLFDIILTITLALGVSIAVSAIFHYSDYQQQLDTRLAQYEEQFGIKFSISEEEYDQMTEEEKTARDEILKKASAAIREDAEYVKLTNVIFYMTVAIVAISAFVAILIWQFLIPLFFGHGRTLGKKIFGLGVIRTNLTKASNPVLFIRAIIGSYTIETMFPLFILVMIMFGLIGSVGIITLLLFFGLQLFVVFSSKTNAAIHDLLCDTVVVDFASQMIFDTEADRIAFEEEEKANEPPSAQ